MLFDPECARAVAAVGGTSAGASSHRAQTEVSLIKGVLPWRDVGGKRLLCRGENIDMQRRSPSPPPASGLHLTCACRISCETGISEYEYDDRVHGLFLRP